MALVGGGASDRAPRAGAALTRVALRARVAVVARRTVGLRRRDAALREAVGRARPGIARIVQRGAVTVLRAEDRLDALGRRGARRRRRVRADVDELRGATRKVPALDAALRLRVL